MKMTEERFERKILKDKLAFGILIISLLFFLLGIFNRFSISFGSNFLTQAITLFSATIWIFLGLAVFCSSILAYFKKYNLMIILLLITLLSITVIVRTSNIDELKDITTEDWTLGPDLDPFLYLRHANEIANGTLQNPDMMRAAPLGAENYAYANLMPWGIFLLQRMVSVFAPISMTYAAIIIPVIFFCISLLGFFLFVYTLSRFKFSKKHSSIIALFASVIYSIIPSMVARTVAGVPEIESLGMVWFWFAFLFYVLAWKKDKINYKVGFGVLAGIFTELMAYTWGGYRFIYMIIPLTAFIFFLFKKEEKNNYIVFFSWIIPALILEFFRVGNVFSVLTRVSDTGFAFIVSLFFIVNLILNMKAVKKKFEKIKIPSEFLSIIVVGLIAFFSLLILKRELLFSLAYKIFEGFLYPWGRGRVGLTVAENRAPYLSEVLGEFGNLFWLFAIGIVIAFYKTITHFKEAKEGSFKKGIFPVFTLISFAILFYSGSVLIGENYSQMADQIDFLILIPIFLSLIGGIYFFISKETNLSLNFSFLFFILALIFSRISPQSTILNGEATFSKILYFSGLIFIIAIILSTYLLAYFKKNERIINWFKEIEFSHVLILVFSFWAIVSMRGAVRLFFIISPMLILTAAFIIPEMYNSRKEINKKVFWVMIIILILAFAQIFTVYSAQAQGSAKGMAPSAYNQQWQNAMGWVRENTPKESIFVHWWDYGYWVQTIGERATMVDGGHQWEYWDHLVGRYILTSPNPESALSIMKTYNISYLLIDSSDIGKYSAFSKIGSDKDGEDRYSQIPTFVVDPAQTRETSNKTVKVYISGAIVDEDILYFSKEDSKEIFIPKETAYLVFVIMELEKTKEGTIMNQPKVGFIYNNQQIFIPVRYLYSQGKLTDYKEGINATISLIPKIGSSSADSDEMGAAMYLSPKVSKSVLAQIYLLNNSEGRYSNFELVHSESDLYVSYLKSVGLKAGEVVYVGGNIRGPIKIWKINPDEDILVNEELLKTSGEYASFDNLTFIKE
jgi:asparagine N-glycosylation enzyme membrane subunit Stt3